MARGFAFLLLENLETPVFFLPPCLFRYILCSREPAYFLFSTHDERYVVAETVEEGREWENAPTKLNQIGFSNRTMAKMAKPTHSPGCAYSANQKNLLSVRFCAPAPLASPPRSWDSNTQCESPVAVSTSFHHRSPTRRLPAMFFR